MEDFGSPPMGGENIPLKELKTETPVPQGQAVAGQIVPVKKKNPLIMALLVSLTLLVGLFIGISLSKKGSHNEKIIPSLSPSKEPETVIVSPIPKTNIEEKLNTIKTTLNNLDLEEKNLQPPVMDFKIRFKIEE